jgi:6-phosphogluconate dehydrogenase (decarboxylating)
MRVGLVGLGRMGEVLAEKLKGKVDLSLYDKVIGRAEATVNLKPATRCRMP